MRYLTYRSGNEGRLGSLQNGYIIDVQHVAGYNDLLELIKAGPEVWQSVAAKLSAINVDQYEAKIPYNESLILTPIAKPPKNVVCLGRNYYKHFLEGTASRGTDEKPPEAPIYFTKPHTAIIGPYDPVPFDPEVTVKLDWEVEMGVIIGTGGRKIKAEDALQHVFGYTVINDVSARDLQFRHQQWYRGKGLDGSCPIGPVVVTPDELPQPVHLNLYLRVNGETKQSANTNQLMFDVPAIIADLSSSHSLEPGDIISTGTPDGVGHYHNPPEYLKPGDIMETEIEQLGIMRNPIVAVS
jgi:2-keto-4-pentenoate hydratase/2-oxohepta-3-ene-1,7-dioic acid hydratase in catechol pathway